MIFIIGFFTILNKKINILFVLPSLKPGGAERVISFLAKSFHKKNHQIILLVLGYEKDKSFDTGNLEIIYLNRDRLLSSVLDILKFIQKLKPNIVFSSIGHINILMGFLSFYFKKIRFIAREASVLSSRSKYAGRKNQIMNLLRSFAYKNLDAIVCQSRDIENDLIFNFNLNKDKLHIIGNPITSHFVHSNKNLNKNSKEINFITVGRFSQVKGHSRIIRGLSKISNYNFHYTMVGDGKLINQIKNEIKTHDLDSKVSFIKYTSNVLEELHKNDYFLQGSYVEGFPNSVLESCSVGVPVIAFNCPGGTKDIIENDKNGYLVNNQNEFESLLIELNEVKKINRDQVIESVIHKFEANYIIGKYLKLFLNDI